MLDITETPQAGRSAPQGVDGGSDARPLLDVLYRLPEGLSEAVGGLAEAVAGVVADHPDGAVIRVTIRVVATNDR